MRTRLAALSIALLTLTGGTVATIATATPAAAEHAPECFDGSPVLRKGSSGACVKQVQRVLQRNGYSLTADGVFGQQTHDRLWRFQGRMGLKQDGIVGPQTGQVLLYCEYGCA